MRAPDIAGTFGAQPRTPVAPRQDADTLRARIVRGEAALEQLAPGWESLARQVADAPLFHHPAVARSWARVLARGEPPLAIAVHQGARLVGILPMMIRPVSRGPTLGVRYDYDPADRQWLIEQPRRFIAFRQLSPILSLPATMTGPMLLAEPGLRPAVIAEIARAIARLPGWDAAVIPLDAQDMAIWQDALAASGLKTRLQPLDRLAYRLGLTSSFADLIAGQKKKLRQNVRRSEAAAAREGLEVTLCTDLDSILPTLANLADLSWKAQGREGQHAIVPYDGPQRRFFEDLLRQPGAPEAVAAIAAQAGNPVAIMLAAVHGSVLTTLLTFWNGEMKEASPGLLVLGALIDHARTSGKEVVDFNSNNPWLRHIADETSIQHNLLAFAPSMRGRALSALTAAAAGLRSSPQTGFQDEEEAP